jgi:XTP/dITP diphosphohydrolase
VNPIERVVLASGNAGKAREFERLLGAAVIVNPLPPDVQLPEETGRSFAENARLKAAIAFAALGGRQTVLADDSGIAVDALDGFPGIISARYAGRGASDEENVRKLLDQLEEKRSDGNPDRTGRFVCCLCVLLAQGGAIEVAGYTEGTITEAPRGSDGFGYDPVFQPVGWTKTLAEADPADKDAISHRGAAARALLAEMQNRGLLAGGL